MQQKIKQLEREKREIENFANQLKLEFESYKRQIDDKIDEIKRKQWCIHCQREGKGIYYLLLILVNV